MSNTATADAGESADSLEAIIQAGRLADTLDVVDAVNAESIFRLGHDGLSVTLVDPANVFMTDLDLAPGAFESVGDGKFPIGLGHERLTDVLSHAENDDPVRLRYVAEKRRLGVRYGRVDATIAAIDPDSIRSEPDMPDLDLPNSVTVDGGVLREAVEIAGLMSSHVAIEADPDSECVRWFVEGDTDDATVEWGGEDVTEAVVREDTETVLSVDYLESATKVMPSDADVGLTFGEEFPLILDWPYQDGHGSVRQVIAPRINT